MALFILIMVLMYSSSINAGGINCESGKETKTHFWQNKPKEYAEIICENMGYPNTKSHLNPFDKHDPGFEGCVKVFEKFLKETKIEPGDAEKFGKYCKTYQIKEKEAEEILVALKPYCWKMSDISKFLVPIDHKSIRITPSDWNNLQYRNMELQKCLSDVRTDEKNKEDSNINLLENYKKMFNGVSRCNCVEIIGFNKIYNKLHGNDEYGSLKLFYEDVCKNPPQRAVLKKQQLEAISKYDITSVEARSSKINLRVIAQFLIYGRQILAKGWYTENDKNSEWPLTYLIQNSPQDSVFKVDIINTMAEAISHGYTRESYDEFIKITSENEINKSAGIWKCRTELVKAFNLDKERRKYINYVLSMYGNDEAANMSANILLKLFLDLKPSSQECLKFAEEVKKITNMFYNGLIFYKGHVQKMCEFIVSPDEMYQYLAAAKKYNRSLNDVSNCLTLIEGIEKQLDTRKYELISKPSDLNDFGYSCYKGLVLKEFTAKLFESQDRDICKTQMMDYEPTQNKEKILNVFKKLYKVEKQFDNISEIFRYKFVNGDHHIEVID